LPNGSTSPLRVAFVGAGNMAREHIRAFSDIPDTHIVGLSSRGSERANALAKDFHLPEVFASIEAMLAQTRPDIVVIAVSELSTVDAMAACVAPGRTILVEKPVGIDLADCRAVRKLALDAQAQVFVGLNRRSYGATQVALSSIVADDGARFVEVHDQEDIAEALRAGRPEAVIRNWMYANSIHLIDYFRIFGRGEISRITLLEPWRGVAPAHVVAHLEFSSGDRGLYHAVWNMPGPWACAVTTSARRVEMRPLERARLQLQGSREVGDLANHEWDHRFKPGFRHQAQQVADFVRYGTRPESVPGIDEALATTELVAKIYGLTVR
jgi:predicted dehydrogenase